MVVVSGRPHWDVQIQILIWYGLVLLLLLDVGCWRLYCASSAPNRLPNSQFHPSIIPLSSAYPGRVQFSHFIILSGKLDLLSTPAAGRYKCSY